MTAITTRADEAPRFSLPGLEFTGLASPSRGSADLCTWRLTVEPGMAATEPHYLDRDEIFMVVCGAIRLSPEGEAVCAGDVAVVPSGAPIQLANAGEGQAEVIVAIPAGFVPTTADGTTIETPPWAV